MGQRFSFIFCSTIKARAHCEINFPNVFRNWRAVQTKNEEIGGTERVV